ncbi:hypothetical protein HN592_01475 [Candidatus Woesearchaeota archaeon]|jgi:hypothetical protein|nr:hypothetical protein [Candidatus Woesearchaeota archaeon]MBT4532295.1 hypothetical protein [archaeon]MBT6638934.1 hypothetical protein [Candidatus Woesearchaeota archaeon]MBT7134164.1 hypothetical protein [Candidatus Woesearchaeota archaeon]MBT7442052.1 hypothetical protein [Candidatus Woesearchaeota archaeon]
MKRSNGHLINADNIVYAVSFMNFYNQYRDPSLDYSELEKLETQIIGNLRKIGCNGKESDDKLFSELEYLKGEITSQVRNSEFQSHFQELSLPFAVSILPKCTYLGAKRINLVNDFSQYPLNFNLSPEEAIRFLVPNYIHVNTSEKRQKVTYPNLSTLVEDNSGNVLISETYQLDRI